MSLGVRFWRRLYSLPLALFVGRNGTIGQRCGLRVCQENDRHGNFINRRYRLYLSWSIAMIPSVTAPAARPWPFMARLQWLFYRLTEHHSLHPLEHVGMYAGSLLPRDTWDHS